MKRSVIAILLLACMLHLSAGTITEEYYSSLTGKTGGTLFTAIGESAEKGYTKLSYSALWAAYAVTDIYTSGTNEGKIWDMYSEYPYEVQEKGCTHAVECYDREHSLPKSWFGENNTYDKNPEGCDLGHLVPAQKGINSRRNNHPYGMVENSTVGGMTTYDFGISATTISSTVQTVAGTSATVPDNTTVFEPKDEYKGDFARMYMYMRAKYPNLDMAQADGGVLHFTSTTTAASDTYYGFTAYSVVLLMQWHRQDPVSDKEIYRNSKMQDVQGNRNPFIDYPYLAEYLWGIKAGQTVDMGTLIPSFSDAFIPGVSDGSGNADDTYTDFLTDCVPVYAITLDANAESVAAGNATVEKNGQTLLNITAPNREHYLVEGYYTTSTCSTKVANADGSLVVDIDGFTNASGQWTKTGATTLYTQWTPQTYYITYHMAANTEDEVKYIAYNESATAPTSTVLNCSTDKIFKGWYTDSIPDLQQEEPIYVNGAIDHVSADADFWAVYAAVNGISEEPYYTDYSTTCEMASSHTMIFSDSDGTKRDHDTVKVELSDITTGGWITLPDPTTHYWRYNCTYKGWNVLNVPSYDKDRRFGVGVQFLVNHDVDMKAAFDKAPTPTDDASALSSMQSGSKVIMNGRLYLRVNGHIYDAMGAMIE